MVTWRDVQQQQAAQCAVKNWANLAAAQAAVEMFSVR